MFILISKIYGALTAVKVSNIESKYTDTLDCHIIKDGTIYNPLKNTEKFIHEATEFIQTNDNINEPDMLNIRYDNKQVKQSDQEGNTSKCCASTLPVGIHSTVENEPKQNLFPYNKGYFANSSIDNNVMLNKCTNGKEINDINEQLFNNKDKKYMNDDQDWNFCESVTEKLNVQDYNPVYNVIHRVDDMILPKETSNEHTYNNETKINIIDWKEPIIEESHINNEKSFTYEYLLSLTSPYYTQNELQLVASIYKLTDEIQDVIEKFAENIDKTLIQLNNEALNVLSDDEYQCMNMFIMMLHDFRKLCHNATVNYIDLTSSALETETNVFDTLSEIGLKLINAYQNLLNSYFISSIRYFYYFNGRCEIILALIDLSVKIKNLYKVAKFKFIETYGFDYDVYFTHISGLSIQTRDLYKELMKLTPKVRVYNRQVLVNKRTNEFITELYIHALDELIVSTLDDISEFLDCDLYVANKYKKYNNSLKFDNIDLAKVTLETTIISCQNKNALVVNTNDLNNKKNDEFEDIQSILCINQKIKDDLSNTIAADKQKDIDCSLMDNERTYERIPSFTLTGPKINLKTHLNINNLFVKAFSHNLAIAVNEYHALSINIQLGDSHQDNDAES